MRSLSSLEKWSYAIGSMPFAVKDAAFVNFVVFYYTQVQGLSGALTGLAMFLALSWDAVSDPVVGSWSDTLRTRWGRRHPMLVAGGIPTAMLFLLLFDPPANLGEIGVFSWLLGVSILLRTFLTIYSIPHTAMGAELSTDYDERTVIAKARVTMGWLAGMALPAIGFLFFFQMDHGADGRLVADNYAHYGIMSAILAAITAAFCIWGTRTVISRLPKCNPDATPFNLSKPIRDIRIAFGNAHFRLTTGAGLAFGMAAGIYTTLSLYLGTYFWEFSSDQLAGMVVPSAVGTLLAFMLLGRLGQHFNKPPMLGVASLVLAVNSVSLIGARLLGVLPPNGDPLIYALSIASTFIAVFAIVTLGVVSASLIADILDEQELKTQQRQEGVFFAAGAFIAKATTGLGALMAGVVIDLVGIKPESLPGTIDPSVLQSLGLFTLVLTGSMALLAYVFFSQISMTREDHTRIKRQLEERAAR
ncbi:MAG: MFS transporter [Halioglobus sp.]|nr:MFS transporter [Halioglobus sp.]